LCDFSIDELRFVGAIKQGDIVWGFITDPHHNIYTITVGDTVGVVQNNVVQITTKWIRVKNQLNQENYIQ
jgi:Tfp pilus assembly protein PilP